MKIAILSRNRNIYSTSRLVEACKMRGHQVEVLDTLKCYMDITATKPSMWYRGRQLRDIDAVIPRIGASITTYGASVIRQFEMMGIYCLTDSIALTRSRDKLRALQMLSRKGIDMPRTGFAHSINNAKQLMGLVGGAPVVVKLCSGTQGKGVVLAETPKAAESVIDAFLELKADFLVQEYIKEAGGSDIRCMVIGNKVVSAIERTAAAGEFRSNLHRGGTAHLVKLKPSERQAAVAAAKAIGLNVSGVDLLRSDRGALVMEVNSSPGLEGIETATRKDVAGKIVEFIEFNARPYTKRGRRG
jgi:ribosomal protein S6--L-glutamate ligase